MAQNFKNRTLIVIARNEFLLIDQRNCMTGYNT